MSNPDFVCISQVELRYLGNDELRIVSAAKIIGGATILLGSACACASTPERHPPVSCKVIGGEKLPSSIQTNLLCQQIKKALADQAAARGAMVEVRVLSKNRLRAVVTTSSGRRLPARTVAVSDRPLSISSVSMLVDAISIDLASEMVDR